VARRHEQLRDFTGTSQTADEAMTIEVLVDREGREEGAMFKWLRKRRAIKSYQRELGPRLRARHGTRRHYTPEEVHGTIREGRFSDEFHCFALAMYCNMTTFDAYHAAEGIACDYGAMRAECNVESFQGADFVDTGYFGHASADGGSGSHDSGGGFFSGFFGGDSGGGGSCDSGGGGFDGGGGGDCGGGSSD
jgi:hypothetical protein